MTDTTSQASALQVSTSCCYWLTGLPGAGKSTIASAVTRRFEAMGLRVLHLDGDDLRAGLNADLQFSRRDRAENVRRIGEVALVLREQGFIVMVSAIAPYRADREMVRERFGFERYFEIFIATPLETCVARDPKGLYAKARRGELRGLTGWDDPYEVPTAPDLVIFSDTQSVSSAVEQILRHHESLYALKPHCSASR